MSEYTQSTTATKREPSVTLSELLSGLGAITYDVAKFACEGIKAGAETYQQYRMDEIESVVNAAPSAQEAVAQLSKTGFEIPVESVDETIKVKLETLVTNNDKAGVTTLVKQIRQDAQTRLQTNLTTLAVESCREIGFTLVTQKAPGIFVARKPEGGGMLKVDLEKTKEGEVKIISDADGFHGSACVEAQNAFQAKLREKGVRIQEGTRRRTDRRPAFVGRQARAHIHTGR